MLSPRRQSTVADLLRLIAGWLVAVVVLQGLAAGIALGSGPLHRHAGAAGSAVHGHSSAERHFHSAQSATADATAAAPVADDAVDLAAFALTAALALLAIATPVLRGGNPRSHVLRHAAAWSINTTCLAPLRRPPRVC
jgi:hypothetical protein